MRISLKDGLPLGMRATSTTSDDKGTQTVAMQLDRRLLPGLLRSALPDFSGASNPTYMRAMLSATANDLKVIESAAIRFKITNKSWPNSIDDLVGDANAAIRFLESKPLDKWTGKAYWLERKGNKLTAHCAGMDGKIGSADDLDSKTARAMTVDSYRRILDGMKKR